MEPIDLKLWGEGSFISDVSLELDETPQYSEADWSGELFTKDRSIELSSVFVSAPNPPTYTSFELRRATGESWEMSFNSYGGPRQRAQVWGSGQPPSA